MEKYYLIEIKNLLSISLLLKTHNGSFRKMTGTAFFNINFKAQCDDVITTATCDMLMF